MQKQLFLATLAFALLVNVPRALAQSEDSARVTKLGTGRYWTLSELDTLSSHRWVWRDPSFKEQVLQTPDSLPDELPYIKKRVAFSYPPQAREQQLETDIEVRALVDGKGKVRAAYIRRDSGFEDMGFEDTALSVARRCRWEPAYLHDKSLPVWITYKNRFRLATTSAGSPITKMSKWSWWVTEEDPSIELTDEPLAESEPAAKNETDSNGPGLYDEPPVALKLSSPVYPKGAEADRVQSSVTVSVLVNKQGRITSATVWIPSDQPGYGFEESALTSALEGRWKPARLKGEPVALFVQYEIKFQLR